MSELSIFAQAGLDAARARAEAFERERLEAAMRPPPKRPPTLAVAEIEVLDGLSFERGPSGEKTVTRYDPAGYAPVQPREIAVLRGHDEAHPVGRVAHLEWAEGPPRRIWGVLEVDEAEAEAWQGRPAYVSPGTTRRGRGPIVLEHVGLVGSTARVAATPVRWLNTGWYRRSYWTRQQVAHFDLLVRAADARQRRARGEELVIHGHPALQDAEILERSAAAVEHVAAGQRLIEIVAVPFDSPTEVLWRGAQWRESFSRGAFREFIASGKQVRVNREHRKGDTVGRVVELRETDRGLIATIRIARTPRGDETLELAAEDMISASIGFSAGPDSRTVDHAARTIRYHRGVRLDHLSLVEDPAFKEAAVLSVRRVR